MCFSNQEQRQDDMGYLIIIIFLCDVLLIVFCLLTFLHNVNQINILNSQHDFFFVIIIISNPMVTLYYDIKL